MGWNMFIFNLTVSLYTFGNTFILGLLAPPRFVGYYAGAEKFITVLSLPLKPVNEALYPRVSHLSHHSRVDAIRLARIGILLVSGCGALIGLLTFLLAPFLVRVLLGEEFGPAVPVMRVLTLMLALDALATALFVQWILPMRLDRHFNILVLGTGVLNVSLALVLVPRYLHLGMAWAVVGSVLFGTIGALYFSLRRR